MIIYSCAPNKEFIVLPGDQVVYGTDEQNAQGFGTVRLNDQGELVVNHKPMRQIVRTYAWVRKT